MGKIFTRIHSTLSLPSYFTHLSPPLGSKTLHRLPSIRKPKLRLVVDARIARRGADAWHGRVRVRLCAVFGVVDGAEAALDDPGLGLVKGGLGAVGPVRAPVGEEAAGLGRVGELRQVALEVDARFVGGLLGISLERVLEEGGG